MVDLLVIGAGLTGLCAAYTAAKAGLSVRVIAKGLGATHWHAGTIDVFGYASGNGESVRAPFDRVDDLARNGRAHPYALLGVEALRSALDDFAALTASLGLPYLGAAEPGRNLLLPSAVGAQRPVYLAPEAQLAGRLDTNQPLLLVGFQGLNDFYPRLIAENLGKQGFTARAAFLPISLITKRRDFNMVWLAEFVEDPTNLERLAEALARLVEPGERIGLPAILGLRHHQRVMEQLRTATNAPIFEIPTLPPSLPGIRLTDALRRHLRELGVRVEIGMEVIGFGHEGSRLRWVETATSARPLRHRATNFLLATGGILGGGIDSDHTGRVWETIFDLPLDAPQQRAEWFRPHFLDPAGQPIFQSGVPVNQHFRPVDEAGDIVYENLWAAGGILANADPIQERSLEGIAIGTGMAAARAVKRET
jgi:glycerol-3-phosphate dehydrogenase subunit B